MSSAFARIILAHVRRLGVDDRRMALPHAGAVRSALGLARIPTASFVELLAHATELVGDEHLGLHAGQRAEASDFGLFGMLQQTSATPRMLEPIVKQIARLFHDQCAFVLERRGAHAYFSYRCSEDGHRQASELAISSFIALARRSWPAYPLVEVHFAHRAPTSTREHESIFRVPVRFGAPYNGYLFAAHHLDELGPQPDSSLFDLLVGHALRGLRPLDFATSVRQALSRGFLMGQSGAEWVALELGVSPRTLHRRLQGEGVSYFDLLDQERRLRAETLLQSGLTESFVASRLGFLTAAAFRKAFKRWTELTPREFRDGLRRTEREDRLSGSNAG